MLDDPPAENDKEIGLHACLGAEVSQPAQEEQEGVLDDVFGIRSLDSPAACKRQQTALKAIDELPPSLGIAAANLLQKKPLCFSPFGHGETGSRRRPRFTTEARRHGGAFDYCTDFAMN